MPLSPEVELSTLSGESKGPSSSPLISREERGKLFRKLRGQKIIFPFDGNDQEKVIEEIELAKPGSVPVEEVGAFIGSRLTSEGKSRLQRTTGTEDLSSLSAADIFNALRPAPQAEIASIDVELKKDLERGPSSLIIEQVSRQRGKAMGEPHTDSVPWEAWLLNPGALLTALRATAEEAAARAEVIKTVGQVAGWEIGVGADDTRRDILLNYVKNLENALSQYVEPYCRERGLAIPEKNSSARMVLLLRINAEMRALQAQGEVFAQKGENLVRQRVNLQAEAAGNKMVILEKPEAIETRKQVHALSEQEWTERLRHALALVGGTPLAAAIGLAGGAVSAITESLTTIVAEHPKVAIPLGIGLGSFTVQMANASSLGMISSETLQRILVNSTLVGGVAAIGTAVFAGLAKRFGEKKQRRIFSKNDELCQSQVKKY